MFGFGFLYSHTNQQTANQSEQNDAVMTKVGVKVLHSLSDEAFVFKSALIQDSAADDALLHLLWRYKGRMDTYTVNCLYSLLSLITVDSEVAHYFASLPGPTYCLARYTDWFRPYLLKQLADAKKGYAGALSGEREEIVAKCLSMMDQYDIFLVKEGLSKEGNDLIGDVKMSSAFDDCPPPLIDIDGVNDGEENIKNLIPASMDKGSSVVANCPAE